MKNFYGGESAGFIYMPNGFEPFGTKYTKRQRTRDLSAQQVFPKKGGSKVMSLPRKCGRKHGLLLSRRPPLQGPEDVRAEEFTVRDVSEPWRRTATAFGISLLMR
jgi:hypothetical protein